MPRNALPLKAFIIDLQPWTLYSPAQERYHLWVTQAVAGAKLSFNYLNDRTEARMHQPTYLGVRDPNLLFHSCSSSLIMGLNYYDEDPESSSQQFGTLGCWPWPQRRHFSFSNCFIRFVRVLGANTWLTSFGRKVFRFWLERVDFEWGNIHKESFISSDGACLILVIDATELITNITFQIFFKVDIVGKSRSFFH